MSRVGKAFGFGFLIRGLAEIVERIPISFKGPTASPSSNVQVKSTMFVGIATALPEPSRNVVVEKALRDSSALSLRCRGSGASGDKSAPVAPVPTASMFNPRVLEDGSRSRIAASMPAS